jgi:membrane associated rhomboid family serine protease
VIKGLFVSNILIWLVLGLFLSPFTMDGIPIGAAVAYYFALWPLGPDFWPWQLITYMFFHGGFLHLFFNMLALWMFGVELENNWGSRKFLVYYLLCGVAGGVANLLCAPLFGSAGATVGASGAVFGVLIAFGMLFPNRPIYIYFLLPIPAKYFIIGYIALELIYGVAGTADGVAHFAHLGGAAFGFVYMLGHLNYLPFQGWWARVRAHVRNPFERPGQYVWRDGRKIEVHEAKFYEMHSGGTNDRSGHVSEEVVNAILDKISMSGYQSLTEEEKRLLNEASKNIH